MKTVLICSECSILAQGLQVVLVEYFQVAGCFRALSELEGHIPATRADLIVIEMSPAVSFETLRRLATTAPGSHIILWFDTISPEFVSQCLSIGIRGILSKTASVETHIRCLTEVGDGNLWIDQALSNSILGVRSVRLTPRERQLISLLVQGLSNKEIAWAMGLSVATVKVYLSRLYPKVGVGDRFELALLALKNVPSASDMAKSTTRRTGEPARMFVFPDIICINSPTMGLRSGFGLSQRCVAEFSQLHAVAAAAMSDVA
jgi:DNA-binding NarL/FixJ family response regulator